MEIVQMNVMLREFSNLSTENWNTGNACSYTTVRINNIWTKLFKK